MGFPLATKRKPKRFLRARFAHAPRYGDHLRTTSLSRRDAETPQCRERIVDDEKQACLSHLLGRPRDDCQACPGFECLCCKIMPVAIVALDRDENVVLAERAAVDRNAAECPRRTALVSAARCAGQ